MLRDAAFKDYTATFYGWWHDELSDQNPQQGGEKEN
jgi:hypothetical protein